MYVRKYLSLRHFAISSLLILTSFGGPVSTAENKYCSITPEHTLCKYPTAARGQKCGSMYEAGITSENRELITNLHNLYRARVASGRELRGNSGPQPTASNMKKLVWDDELATIAQRLANQCQFVEDCSRCRTVSRYNYVGQNLGESIDTIRRSSSSNWTITIKAWYEEVTYFSRKNIQPFNNIKGDTRYGHYTQMIWADTERIGCGYVRYRDGHWNKKLYICNYAPAGNIDDSSMYQQGTPCSGCSTCSVKYPGLCSTSQ